MREANDDDETLGKVLLGHADEEAHDRYAKDKACRVRPLILAGRNC